MYLPDVALVDISTAELKHMPPNLFNPIKYLRFLWIGLANSVNIDPAIFDKHISLTELGLIGANNETKLLLGELFPNLEELFYSSKALKKITADSTSGMDNLKKIDLRDHIESIEPGVFRVSGHLNSLFLKISNWHQQRNALVLEFISNCCKLMINYQIDDDTI